MNRTELLDSVAGFLSGVAAAVTYSVLFVAMNAPVVETVRQVLS